MATNVKRHFVGRPAFRWAPTLTAGLFIAATLVYIAFVPVEFAAPQMSEALWFAQQDQPASAERVTDGVDSQAAAGVTTAALPMQRATQRGSW